MDTLKHHQQIIGNLPCVADSTQPDVYFLATRLAVAANSPTQRHWNALKRLIRYLKGTPTRGLTFRAGTHTDKEKPKNLLVSYAEADFAADIMDGKYISGTVHTYNGTLPCWGPSSKTSQHYPPVRRNILRPPPAPRRPRGPDVCYRMYTCCRTHRPFS